MTARGISYVEEAITIDLSDSIMPVIPAYDTVHMVFECGDEEFSLTCPSFFFGGNSGCELNLLGSARGFLTAGFTCVGGFIATIGSGGLAVAGAGLACTSAAIDLCCAKEWYSWCCY